MLIFCTFVHRVHISLAGENSKQAGVQFLFISHAVLLKMHINTGVFSVYKPFYVCACMFAFVLTFLFDAKALL